MFSFPAIEAKTKAQFYAELASQTAALLHGEHNAIANLSNTAALLNLQLSDINWVGFYLWSRADSELILGPFQGKPACIRIPLGKGVCGTAAATRTVQVVPDVFAFPGHIACDAASRSEIVVPLLKDGELIGVLDIDSPTPARFDDADADGLCKVASVLMEATDFAATSELAAPRKRVE